MKKKVLTALLCVSMTAALFAGCGKTSTETTKETETQKETETESEPDSEAPVASLADPEDLPAEFAHLTFDGEGDEGYSALVQVEDIGDNDGGNYGLAAADAQFVYQEGPVGNCLYLDGTYGLDLGLEPTQTDAYTVSFWVNADRLSNYGPTLQIGHNMGKAENEGNDVTWLNVTQNAHGNNDVSIFPVAWSRNEASDAEDGTDCWPWMYAFDDEIHGKREWVMVTIVCSGEEQTSPLGPKTVGAQFYINGVKTYDSQENYTNGTYFDYTWDATLAPNIMKTADGVKFESLFGINYWDTVFKGFVDDLYIYDQALTAGQVASLFLKGDATVEAVAGEVQDETEAEIILPEITEDASATDILGTTARDMGFWSDWTASVEIADGAAKTVKLNNYSNAVANWNNYVIAFCNVATTAHSAPADVADYAEYVVARADAFAWGPDEDGVTFEFTNSWGDDWDAFVELMKDAEVTIKITRDGAVLTLDTTFVAADGTEYTQQGTLNTRLTAADPCYFFITGEGCYIEILSVE